MNLRFQMAFAAAMALTIGTAAAFQEQQSAPASNPPATKAAAPAQNLDTAAPPAAQTEGTEVTIPGLGKLGVLPKMDFGLELLYGANDQPKIDAPATPAEQSPDDQELRIRGSIKKNF